METDGNYYLGRIYDQEVGETTGEPMLYDPDDLTTHAVAVGMTGSGKTGLCIDLLEEAALNGVPALLIDPKGDMTNALLHFPDLSPQDFQPWVHADAARREGKTIEQAAADAAERWRNGLAEWGIGPERLKALGESAHFAVYTPGSDAGIPVSILSTLNAPEIPWESNRELLREKITGTVTALLGLVGLQDIDPVRSREHILLANIFEHAWSSAKNLDLGELILQTQNPPFDKLGVFDVDTFFPEKERFELAMLLNNILAAPAFQTWIEGQPLEIAALLRAPDGKPRHSVFYLAHLSEAERMFFVTLLYAAVETWMRAQPGSNTLRALVYFDEIYGYLPPVSNPPSKDLILRMLKQARAFGVGQVLVTQNPVDVDYKALSNAGTWFIGKLQTEQDKARLLDGLESAASGALDRGEYDRLISGLGKRVFLLHNVHAKRPQLFQTRWAMNFLAGPLTRTQIPALNRLVGAAGTPAATEAAAPAPKVETSIPPPARVQAPPEASAAPQPNLGTTTRPVIPSVVEELFLPNNLTLSQAAKTEDQTLSPEANRLGLRYRPVLLAQVSIRFLQRKYSLDHQARRSALVIEPDQRGIVRWDDHLINPIDPRQLDRQPAPEAYFTTLEALFNDDKALRALKSDFADWAYRTTQITVRANETLKIYAAPDVPQAEFRRLCADAAREQRDAEIQKVTDSYAKQIERVKDKLAREERELSEDEAELSQRKMEELGTHAENILSFFGSRSRRRISTSLSKRRMTAQAKAEVEESEEAIKKYLQDVARLEKEKVAALEELQRKWGEIAEEQSEIPITPYQKDILIELFGVAWFPYHVVEDQGRTFELPGFSLAAE